LPIKIFVINNGGYASLRQLLEKYFKKTIGTDKESGLGLPNICKIAEAYGIPSKRIDNMNNLSEKIKEVILFEGPILCEVVISDNQKIEPKQGTFERLDGKVVPRPIEDMFPYISREELAREMLIDLVPFEPYQGED